MMAVTGGVVINSCLAALDAQERAALVDIYVATGGPFWSGSTSNTNWLVADPCSNRWAGVVCNIDQTSVRGILLHNNGLTGTLPASLSAFQNLQRFDISTNLVGGTIPLGLSAIKTLTGLSLSYNRLSDQLQSLGTMPGLVYLAVDNNQFFGPLPTLSAFPSLTDLYAHNNLLVGPIPTSVASLRFLTALTLSGNYIGGAIPSQLGQLSNQLEALWLGNNALTGIVPAALVGMGQASFDYNCLVDCQYARQRWCFPCDGRDLSPTPAPSTSITPTISGTSSITPTTSTTPSLSPTISITSSPSPSHRTVHAWRIPLAPMVGGVLGGAILVGYACFLLYRYKARRSRALSDAGGPAASGSTGATHRRLAGRGTYAAPEFTPSASTLVKGKPTI